MRRARVGDVRRIKDLVDCYAGAVLLTQQLVTLYEDVQEFWVAERDGLLVGCGALHVVWEDLAEIRTMAVHPDVTGRGVGQALATQLVDHGRLIEGTPVTREVYQEMRRSHDEGVAELLDLPHVKPNTLGNIRMLLEL